VTHFEIAQKASESREIQENEVFFREALANVEKKVYNHVNAA
jgi:hypothetical protein